MGDSSYGTFIQNFWCGLSWLVLTQAVGCSYHVSRTGAAAGGDEDATKDAIAAVKLYNTDMASAKKLDAHRQALFEADRSKEVGARDSRTSPAAAWKNAPRKHATETLLNSIIITHRQDGTVSVHLIAARWGMLALENL
jgi:hypothetical protein